MAIAQALFMLLTLGASPAPPAAGGDYIKVEIRGTLRTGVMAIGGETTGTVVTARGANWDLDVTHLPEGGKKVEALDGRAVLVKGTLEIRPGVERRERAIVTVTSLEAAPARP